MTPTIPVSVVIVSRDRPAALTRCLTGTAQLLYPSFEIVLVADPKGIAAAIDAGLGGRIKLVPFDEANISAARNAGIKTAAGDVVAFLDDDAVPEPTWLSYLVAPFVDPEVMAAGGYVRGRNGISYQWRAQGVDGTGASVPLDVGADGATVVTGQPGSGIKTEGTNCAFRRSVLALIGGFDPVFRFYLDETDVNLRLAAARHKTAIVPLAEVHHGFAANRFRRENRAPRDLFEIGASFAAFLRKHAAPDQRDAAFAVFRSTQRRRLVRYMVDGRLEPRDVRRILAGLESGFSEGEKRPLAPLTALSGAPPAFLRFNWTGATGASIVVAGRIWQRRALRKTAAERVNRGDLVSVFIFSHTALFHSVRFHPDGYWEQRGGLFGRSDRSQPMFRLCGFRARLAAEIARVGAVRRLQENNDGN
ncbi:glycosyltransferase family 2 protein [Pseudogemmobacter sp. W21_MBD1_M6]|uniref:glycosyltransferase family 2 protein n=1 Tax=Pseudogemmobacter sp. W21_MBD1_M6 TaxID=3240271 RepID=UPI003F97DD6A